MSSHRHLLIEFHDKARSGAPTSEYRNSALFLPPQGQRVTALDGMMESPFLSSIFIFCNETSAELSNRAGHGRTVGPLPSSPALRLAADAGRAERWLRARALGGSQAGARARP